MADPTACDKYELPEPNLRMCTRVPNIDGHDTSQPRSLEPQGLIQRRSLSKKDEDDSSSSSDDDNRNNGKRIKKLRRKRCICLILVAIVMVLFVTQIRSNTNYDKPSLSYMPSWNNYT